MGTIKNLFLAVISVFALTFQSCDSDDQMNVVEDMASVSEQNEEKEDGMFAVNFVNPDGTPFISDGLTKVVWGGSYSTYPYGTQVTTTWGTFCSTGEKVELSGGDGGSVTLTSSSSSYMIANSIDQDYNITVNKIAAPPAQTKGSLEIFAACDGLYRVTVSFTGNFDTSFSGSGECQTTLSLDPGSYHWNVQARGYLQATGGSEQVLTCSPASGITTIRAGQTSYINIDVSYGEVN